MTNEVNYRDENMMMDNKFKASSIPYTYESYANIIPLESKHGFLILDIRMPVMTVLNYLITSIESNVEACFITAYEDYREEFKESFPILDEAKYFIRKPKAIED